MRQVDINRYRKALHNLAVARIKYAEAFVLRRAALGDKATDGQAHQAAVIDTQDDVTIWEGEVEITRRELDG